MAKPWEQVVESKEFLSLGPADRGRAMRQYFDQVVAPQLETPGAFDNPAAGYNKNDAWKQFQDFTVQRLGQLEGSEPMPSGAKGALIRFGKGMLDIGQGAKQIALERGPQSLEAMGRMATGDLPGGVKAVVRGSNPQEQKRAQDYTKDVQSQNALYEQGRQIAGQNGFDWWRLGGNVAAAAPLAVLPGGGTTALGRMGAGALAGGVGGATQFVPEGGSRTQNALVGAAIGGVTAPVAGAIVDTAKRVYRQLVPAAASSGAGAAQQRASAALQQAANQQGVDLSQLPQNILQRLQQDAADALAAGQRLDARAMLRRADFQAAGIQPTLGQVTRDPMQYAAEVNMRGIQGAGEPMATRFAEQNTGLIDRLNQMGAGQARGAMETGQQVIRTVEGADRAARATINDLYSAARDQGGRIAALDVPAFSRAANDALDSQMLGYALPTQARRILNDVSSGRIPLNVQTAEQIKTVLGNMGRGASVTDAQRLALQQVRSALDNVPLSAEAAGATEAFGAARAAARQRFQAIENTPAVRAVVEGVEPDRFFRDYVVNARSAADVRNLVNFLQQDPAATAAIRAEVINHLKQTALNGATDEVGKFSQSAYNKELNRLMPKLGTLFTPQEVADLSRLGRVASYIQSAPAGAAVNSSNTASAMMNLISRIGGTPGVNILRNSVRQFSAERAARQALAARLASDAARGATQANQTNALILPFISGAGAAAANATQ